MKYAKVCDHCGGKKVAYSHKLNSPLVSALKQIVEFYDRTHRACKLQQDLNLTKNQYNNFQKLQHFQLVVRKTEGWYPTHKGSEFIRGEVSISPVAASLGGETLEPTHEAWRTHKAKIKLVRVEDFIAPGYKKRIDYQKEHPLNLSLFPTL